MAAAKTMRTIHGGLTLTWVGLWAAAFYFGWLASVEFVAHVSMAALVLASVGGWQGARAEETADSDG